MRGLAAYDGAPVEQMRGATRLALRNLVDLALGEGVAFVLIAGDLYDGDWQDFQTGLFFAAQMTRLREAGVRVFLVRGNHDAASRITRSLTLPENVHVFAAEKCDTVVLDDPAVAVHGRSFASPAVREDLSEGFPRPIEGLVNIGLLHTSANRPDGHEPYAPCSPDGLVARGYDYWALGHVHNRRVLCRPPERRSWVVFPGNTQGRNIRECGPKGCSLVTVHEPGRIEVAHRDLDVARWAHLQVDASGAADGSELIARARAEIEAAAEAAEGRPLAARVVFAGACAAHEEIARAEARWVNELRAAATDVTGGQAWLEKVRFGTAPTIDLDALRERDSAVGDLLRYLGEVAGDEDELGGLAKELTDLKAKLPAELTDGPDGLDLDSPAAIRAAIEDVERLLLPRLLAGGADE